MKKPTSPLTPIPTTHTELSAMVARIYDGTKQITNEYLPRVEKIASEARDGVNILNGRVSVLESIPPHSCEEKDRQSKQDTDIEENKETLIENREKLNSLNRLKGWALGIVGSIATAILVFAVTTKSTEATNTANIQNNNNSIIRHERIIQDLPRKQDLEAIKQIVTEIPAEVKTSIEREPPTASGVFDDAEELLLKDYELKQLRIILDRAKKREFKKGRGKIKISEE